MNIYYLVKNKNVISKKHKILSEVNIVALIWNYVQDIVILSELQISTFNTTSVIYVVRITIFRYLLIYVMVLKDLEGGKSNWDENQWEEFRQFRFDPAVVYIYSVFKYYRHDFSIFEHFKQYSIHI